MYCFFKLLESLSEIFCFILRIDWLIIGGDNLCVESVLLTFLNDQRFRWISSLILLVGFFIGSLQDMNYELSLSVLEGMFPALLYTCVVLGPIYRRRKLYKLIYKRALRNCGSQTKVFFYVFLGLHGKLLGINIVPKSKFKWSFIIFSYIVFIFWLIQSEMPLVIKLLIIVIATYRAVVAINS